MNSLLFQVAGYSNSSDLSLGILLVEFALGLVMMISYSILYRRDSCWPLDRHLVRLP